MKIRVSINRGHGKKESFIGELKSENTSHMKVQHDKNHDGEWFAINSTSVQCEKVEE